MREREREMERAHENNDKVRFFSFHHIKIPVKNSFLSLKIAKIRQLLVNLK